MDYNTPHLNSWPAKFVVAVGKKIRSNRKYTQAEIDRQNAKDEARRLERLRSLASQRSNSTVVDPQAGVNELGEREYSIFSEASTLVETNRDYTDMMHGLAHHDSFDSLLDGHGQRMIDKLRDAKLSTEDLVKISITPISIEDERRVSSLPDDLWQRIAGFLDALSAANLAMASKTLFRKLGNMPFEALNHEENKHAKHKFLHQWDHLLPDHLFCFPCGRHHRRSQPGKETLKIDYVNNPLFRCPSVKSSVLPRIRLTHGRELPYHFVQLAVRHTTHSRKHGIHADNLARRWKCKDSGWSHRTRYMVHDGRLLMRVVSQTYAPPSKGLTVTAERHLLYDREEYTPYFSVCAHWRDGELMKLCKCALSHVPAPPDPYHKQLQRGFKVSRSAANPNFIVRGCDDCRPARRCPDCPTEYLIEVQMMEDPKDPVFPFKHAIVVTRWSDLGNGRDPWISPEWAAINGRDTAQGYEKFSNVGRRAVGGIFESKISGTVPGQRLLSLNPKNAKLGEEGHGWY